MAVGREFGFGFGVVGLLSEPKQQAKSATARSTNERIHSAFGAPLRGPKPEQQPEGQRDSESIITIAIAITITITITIAFGFWFRLSSQINSLQFAPFGPLSRPLTQPPLHNQRVCQLGPSRPVCVWLTQSNRMQSHLWPVPLDERELRLSGGLSSLRRPIARLAQPERAHRVARPIRRTHALQAQRGLRMARRGQLQPAHPARVRRVRARGRQQLQLRPSGHFRRRRRVGRSAGASMRLGGK